MHRGGRSLSASVFYKGLLMVVRQMPPLGSSRDLASHFLLYLFYVFFPLHPLSFSSRSHVRIIVIFIWHRLEGFLFDDFSFRFLTSTS